MTLKPCLLNWHRLFAFLGLCLTIAGCQTTGASSFLQTDAGGVGHPVHVLGEQSLLVIGVKFPDVPLSLVLSGIGRKAEKVSGYIRTASYGKAWLKPRVVGWYEMPEPIARYRVSAFNSGVAKYRVEKLLVDALSRAQKEVNLGDFKNVWVVVGAQTMPGKGYGMIAYAANPGMLSCIMCGEAEMKTIALPEGGHYSAGVIVSAYNAHLGHVSHDLLHALGRASGGKRAVPDLYDFALQNDPTFPRSPALIAIHAGPWDIMSQHFIDWSGPPPLPSSFTRLQLGWIAPEQIFNVDPATRAEFVLMPLVRGKGLLVANIPLDRHRHLLLENRQRIGGDSGLPDSGLLVLEINTAKAEGSGIVRVIDSDPTFPLHGRAPFRADSANRRVYRNSEANVRVTVSPVQADGAMKVVVSPLKDADKN